MKTILQRISAVMIISAAMLAPAAAADSVKVGTLFSLTGGGAVLSYSAQAGARLAADEINRSGGMLGKQVELVAADDKSDPTLTVLEARRLVHQEKVDLVLGPLGSLTTLPALPILTEAGIANISVAQAKQITPELAPYHFTLVVNTDEIARVYLRFAVNELGAKRIGVLIDKTAGQKALLDAFNAAMAEFPGAEIVAVQEFDLEATDQLPQMLALREQKADVILHSSLAGHDAGVSLAAREDISWDVPIVLSTSAANALAAVTAVAGAEVVAGDNVFAWDYKALTYCTGDVEGTSPLAQFLQRMYAFAPETKGKVSATNALWIYDALHFLDAAVEGAGTTEGPAVAKWIEQNAGTLTGVLGTPKLTPESHFMFGADDLTVIRNIDEIRSDGLRRRAGC